MTRGPLGRARARLGRGVGHAWSLLVNSVRAFLGDRGTQFAAAISYYALLSLFPAAIVLAAGFGLFIEDREARDRVVDTLFDALPLSDEGRSDLESVVTGVTRNSGAVGVAGLVGLVISASALMGAVRTAINVVFGASRGRPPLRGKALDILFVAFLGVLAGLSLAATIATQFAVDIGDDLGISSSMLRAGVSVAGWLTALALSALAFTLVLRVIPQRKPPLRDIWPGVAFATAGYEVAKRGFSLYLENFANYSAVYGSLGAVIALLAFVYIAAIVFLIGAEMAALWPRVRRGDFDSPPDEEGEPFGRQVLGFLRGLVVDTSEREHDEQEEPRHGGEAPSERSDRREDREAGEERVSDSGRG